MLHPRAVDAYLQRPFKDYSLYKRLRPAQLDQLAARHAIEPVLWQKLKQHQKIMLLLCLRSPRFALWADTGCLAGETLLATERGPIRIDSLHRPTRVWAQTESGPRLVDATCPFKRGPAALYEVRFASGRSITVTARHRFLSARGWLSCASAERGELLPVFDVCQPRSILEPYPSRYRPNADHCCHKETDLTACCYSDRHRDDVQPLDATTDDLAFFPLQDEIQECSHDGLHLDVLASTNTNIPCPWSGPLSTSRCERPSSLWSNDRECLDDVSLLKSPVDVSHISPIVHAAAIPLLPDRQDAAWDDACAGKPLSALFDSIVSVQYKRTDLYYDLHVPVHENYIAHGLCHHNTGKTLTVLAVAHQLHAQKQLQRVLVLVPRKVNKAEWQAEIEKHLPELPFCVLPSALDQKLRVLEGNGALIVLETYNGLYQLACEKVRVKGGKNKLKPSRGRLKALSRLFDGIVLDECFTRYTRIHTPQGMRYIRSLEPGDVVYSSDGTSIVKRVLRKQSSLVVRIRLSDGMIITCTPNHPFFTTQGWVCAGNLEGHHVLRLEDVFKLRAAVRDPIPQLDAQAMLQSILRCEAQNEPTTVAAMAGQAFAKSDAHEDQCNVPTHRQATEQAWWQRYGLDQAPSDAATQIRPAVATGTCNRIGAEAAWLSNALHGRLSTSYAPPDHRSRWRKPSSAQEAKIRPQTRSIAFGVRVEDVTTEELTSPVDVFDLELEGTPHFYAEGLLVHNSHNCKTKNKLPFRICYQLAKAAKLVLTLSGTPHGRDPSDLWGQMMIVDRGETLGETLGLFRAVFCGEQQGFFANKFVFHKRKSKLLNRILNNRSIRFVADEVELPPLVAIVKRFSLPEDADSYYRRAMKTLKLSKGNYREMRNAWLRMRQISSGFVGYHDDEAGKTAEFEFAENPKLELLLSLVEGIADKTVIFYEYTYSGLRIARELQRLGIKAMHLYGGSRDQAELRRRFNEEGEQILVMQNQFGEGLNLQAAKYAIFYESPVRPVTRKQCIRRVERQGSTHERVFQYDLVCRGTVDDQILAFLQEGKDLFEAIIDGKAKLPEQ